MTEPLHEDSLRFLDDVRDAHDPSEADRARMERALGLVVGGAAIAASGTALKATGTGTGAISALITKVVVVAVIGTGVTMGVLHMRSSREDASQQVAANRSPRAVTATAAQNKASKSMSVAAGKTQQTDAIALKSTIEASRSPSDVAGGSRLVRRAPQAVVEVAEATAATSVATPATTPTAETEGTLSRETIMLAQGLSALRESRASDALAAADRHAAEFPNGTMTIERRILRIKALCALGRTNEARQEATALRGATQNDAVERRIANTCAGQ